LQAKVELADRTKHLDIMRLHRGHDALSYRKHNPLFAQISDKFAGDGRA